MILARLNTFVLLFLLVYPADAAEKPREINWENLVPEMPQLDNPFERLSTEQIIDFEMLMSIRSIQRNQDISDAEKALEDGIEIRYKLERQGLDVEGLIADYERLEKEVVSRNLMTNQELDGEEIRIPGYALPLETQGTGVKELLLVPYVGACIHVPPPPANQTVYVKLKETHTFKDVYEPVWITGRLSIKSTNQTLSLVDGSAGVDTGYLLEGVKIEPYEEE